MKRFLKIIAAFAIWYIGSSVIGLATGFLISLLLDHIAIKTTFGMIIFYVFAGPPILTASFYLTLLTSILLEKKTETIVYATIVIMLTAYSQILNMANIPLWFMSIGVLFGGIFAALGKDDTKEQ